MSPPCEKKPVQQRTAPEFEPNNQLAGKRQTTDVRAARDEYKKKIDEF
jgi:hypothetical protein